MGLFTSSCKNCNADLTWFLEAHDRTCKCGTFMTALEIEESWYKNCRENYTKSIVAQMKKSGDDLDAVCKRLCLNPDGFRELELKKEVS